LGHAHGPPACRPLRRRLTRALSVAPPQEPQGKVQGDLELEGDGAARERAGPDASHLLAVAERADAFLSEVGPPRLFDWERVRERAKERE